MMEGVEDGILSEKDLRETDHIWEQGEKAFALLNRIVRGGKNGFHPFVPTPSENNDLDVLADIISFCMIVVNRLNLVTVSNMIKLIHAATGHTLSAEDLRDTVSKILEMEAHLQNKEIHLSHKPASPLLAEDQIKEIVKKEERDNESIVHQTTS
jgi:aldehyde:ferredoxin oxidoreductase